ncbi:MAG TPA: hypothetical protein VFF58_00515 [Candidatus Nitrosotalea sp.]|nr:hypothetical protein [Candidatus Nitrosotalea sp.]
MTAQILIGLVCGVIAILIAVALLHDLLIWVYQEGRAKGRQEAEAWWLEQGKQVDQARQQVWREDARKAEEL